MPNDAYTQQALGRDSNFWTRVRANLMSVAWEVMNEPTTTEFHSQRAAYARQVINSPDSSSQTIAQSIVMRPNVFTFETTYSFPASAVVTAAGDPDIRSQLMTDWNDLAGIVE